MLSFFPKKSETYRKGLEHKNVEHFSCVGINASYNSLVYNKNKGPICVKSINTEFVVHNVPAKCYAAQTMLLKPLSFFEISLKTHGLKNGLKFRSITGILCLHWTWDIRLVQELWHMN